jgi:hypothetical protein
LESLRSGRNCPLVTGNPCQYHERQGIFSIRMIETFVSFVIFVVTKIGLSIPWYPQESLKTLLN